MIPTPYRNNFTTLSRAFDDGAVCLVECTERDSGKPAYVICAVCHCGSDVDLIPFARLFDENPYEFLVPPGTSRDTSCVR